MTCFGADMSDPRYNVFYSRDYIFNFGCPFYGTGALLTLHAAPKLDLYAGIDRGVNVALEDNNDSVSFYGGTMMHCCEGKACCVAMLHAGPEDPRNNHDGRYLSDIVTTWKITEKLTSITDINLIYEKSVSAKGYGIAQYLTYAIMIAVRSASAAKSGVTPMDFSSRSSRPTTISYISNVAITPFSIPGRSVVVGPLTASSPLA